MSWAPLRDVRGRLLAIVVVALALALAVTTYGFNALFVHTAARDADALLRARASSELAVVQLRNGRLKIAETSDDAIADSQVWVYSGTRRLEGTRRTRAALAAQTLAGGPSRFLDVPAADIRLLSVPIVDRGRRAGTLVVGLSLAPYEQTQTNALIGSLALAATLLTLVGAAVYWLLRSALLPVARMTEQAAAWSEHDLDRRFGLGEPHDELTRLAATLDGLLDRISASLRHERRFSAELSHELRTPLARVIAEAELALRRERGGDEYRAALEVVLADAEQIARIVETLVAAARQDAGDRGVADAAEVAQNVVDACTPLAAERGLDVTFEERGVGLRIGVDGDLAERILHPVVDNACRYGRAQVRVTLFRAPGGATFVIEDDGPGVDRVERETIFEPAARGTAGRAAGVGAGLGLALARRLARSAAGDVEVEPGRGGRFVIRLPVA